MTHLEDRALARAIVTTLILGAAKMVVALITRSQALLASAVDSLTDGVVTGFNLFMLRQARMPADEGHPFGHGKVEALAALAQGTVLAIVVGVLAYNAVGALVTPPAEPPEAGLATVAIGVSLATSFAISTFLSRAAQRTGSLVLRTDAVHYRMDLLSGSAVLAGLLVTLATRAAWADAAASLVVCVLMGKDVFGVLREAVDELMDRPFPAEEREAVETVLRAFPGRVLRWHDLRTRKSGPHRFVQVHVVMPADWSFTQAHELSDELERRMRDVLPHCDAIVHADPAGVEDATDTVRGEA